MNSDPKHNQDTSLTINPFWFWGNPFVWILTFRTASSIKRPLKLLTIFITWIKDMVHSPKVSKIFILEVSICGVYVNAFLPSFSSSAVDVETGIILTLKTPLQRGEYSIYLRVFDNNHHSQDNIVLASVWECTGNGVWPEEGCSCRNASNINNWNLNWNWK